MRTMLFITIPKSITGDEELIVLPRPAFERLLEEKSVSEDAVLRWSREAKKLKRTGGLTILKSLRNLR